MKRKVIQLAEKTSVVSLPSKWVKKFNVKKGDELELIESGKDLIIKTDNLDVKKSISLDISDFNERSVRYAASALHKFGYDEISFLYKDKKQVDLVNELLRILLLGFVMVEHTPKRMVLRSVTSDKIMEFDSTLRRAFLVTLSLADSSFDIIKNKDYANLESLISLENTNNQLTSFCLRLINKGMYKDENKKNFISLIIWSLEKIADEYKYICQGLKQSVGNDVLKVYEMTNSFLRNYYELFYNFDINKLNKLVEDREELLMLIGNINPDSNELKLLNNLTSIISKLSDLSSSIFALHMAV